MGAEETVGGYSEVFGVLNCVSLACGVAGVRGVRGEHGDVGIERKEDLKGTGKIRRAVFVVMVDAIL
jgi:hypothetical protein